MKTTKWITATLMAALAGFAIGVSGCKSACCSSGDHPAAGAHAGQYTCAMHPELVQAKPGNCPKCGMALTEKP